jgi:membrane protein
MADRKTPRGRPDLGTALRILKETAKSFEANGNFEISAALATYGFFAFLPLLFFLGYLFGNYAVFSQKIIQGIDQMVLHMFPRTDRLITRDLYFFTDHRLVWAVFGLSFVIVPVMTLTDTLRTSFDRIFRYTPEVPFLRARLQNLRSALYVVLLFVVFIPGEIFYTRVFGPPGQAGKFLAETIPVFSGAFLFLLVLYWTFPPLRLTRRQLLTATILSAALLLAMREIFSIFISFSPGFGEAFGALKTLFIMILWVYYCFLVILFGAELMVHIGRLEALVLKDVFSLKPFLPGTNEKLMRKFLREYAEGEVVFNLGEYGERMYYILSGSVKISGESGYIRVMGPGEYFGEMSMLLDAPRTATVTVMEAETRLINISRKNFEVILRDNPLIVLEILKEMTRRLKETSRR